LVEPEVSKVEYFRSKKKFSMLDRTLTTPNSIHISILKPYSTYNSHAFLKNTIHYIQHLCIKPYKYLR